MLIICELEFKSLEGIRQTVEIPLVLMKSK